MSTQPESTIPAPKRRAPYILLVLILITIPPAITYPIAYQAGANTNTIQTNILRTDLYQKAAQLKNLDTYAPPHTIGEFIRTFQHTAAAPPATYNRCDRYPYHLIIYTVGCTAFGNTYLMTLTGPTSHYDRGSLLALAAQELHSPTCQDTTTIYLFDKLETQTQALTILQNNQDPAFLAQAHIQQTPTQYTLTTPQVSTPL